MKISIQAKYFLIAIIGIGSMGIWLPFLMAYVVSKEIPLDTIPINLTTFYISIYFAGCVDYILARLGDMQSNTKSVFLNMIALIILSFALIISTVWMSINGKIVFPTLIAIVGTVIALILWWKNNTENPNFDERIRDEAEEKHGKKW
jgi:hypothetical protein